MSNFTIVQKGKSQPEYKKNNYRVKSVSSDDLGKDIVGGILNISSESNEKNINYSVFFLSGNNKEIPKLFTLDPYGQFFSELDLISGNSFNLIYIDFIKTGDEKITKKAVYEGITYVKEEGQESVLLNKIQSIMSSNEFIEDPKKVKFPFAFLVKHKGEKFLKMTDDIGVLEFNPPKDWNENPMKLTRYLMAFMIEIRNVIDDDRKESGLNVFDLNTFKSKRDKYSPELSKINVEKIIFTVLIKEWIEKSLDYFDSLQHL